jgi:hypothetical protein
VFSTAQPLILAKLKQEFSLLMAQPEYDIAFLFAASGAMGMFERFGHYAIIQGELRRESQRMLEERRFSEFADLR